MIFKVFVLTTLITIVRCSIIPIILTPVQFRLQDQDYDENPHYSFSYDVHDPITGDIKNQRETRAGNLVQGEYSLIDSDGSRRIVNYASDPIRGFSAIIRRDPLPIIRERNVELLPSISPRVQVSTQATPTTPREASLEQISATPHNSNLRIHSPTVVASRIEYTQPNMARSSNYVEHSPVMAIDNPQDTAQRAPILQQPVDDE